MKEEDYTKKDIIKTETNEEQIAGMPTNFYGKVFKGINKKQKKVLIIATAVSVFAGVGLYTFYKVKNKFKK